MSWLNILEIGLAAFFGSAATGLIAYIVYKGTMEENFRNHIQSIQNVNKRHEETLRHSLDLQSDHFTKLQAENTRVLIVKLKLDNLLKISNELIYYSKEKPSLHEINTRLDIMKVGIKCIKFNHYMLIKIVPYLSLFPFEVDWYNEEMEDNETKRDFESIFMDKSLDDEKAIKKSKELLKKYIDKTEEHIWNILDDINKAIAIYTNIYKE